MTGNESQSLDGQDNREISETSVQQYLSVPKNGDEKTDNLNDSNDLETLAESNAASTPLDKVVPFNFENIFKFGYSSVVKSEDRKRKWETLSNSTAADGNHQENPEENEVTEISTDDKEIEIMKWIPVEPSIKKSKVEQTSTSLTVEHDHVKYEHFNGHFKECSEQLWENGLSFNNVDNFNDWFHYEWEAQLYAVRNFVQHSIYVEEMCKYNNTKAGVE